MELQIIHVWLFDNVVDGELVFECDLDGANHSTNPKNHDIDVQGLLSENDD